MSLNVFSLQISLEICRMQQLMGFLSTWRSQEVIIKLLNGFVFMRHSHFMLGIDGINTSRSLFQDFQITMMIRLSTAAYTAARTGHDFNGMVIAFSFSDAFQERSGVTQAVCDGEVQRQIANGDGG